MDAKSSCDNYGWKNTATICDVVRKAMPKARLLNNVHM
jgi:hypothetical protein